MAGRVYYVADDSALIVEARLSYQEIRADTRIILYYHQQCL